MLPDFGQNNLVKQKNTAVMFPLRVFEWPVMPQDRQKTVSEIVSTSDTDSLISH